MSPNSIEMADYLGGNRLQTAGESLELWYKHKHNELIKKHLDFTMSAAKETNQERRHKLKRQADEVLNELNTLNKRMEFSSLRRALQPGKERTILAGDMTERRLMPTAAPGRLYPAAGASDTGPKTKLNGLAAVYNQWAEVGHFYREKIRPGAFAECIKTSDVRCLFNHDSNHLLGRSANKSLRLYDSHIGLIYWNDMLDGDMESDAIVKRIERRDLSGCSFCFTVAEDTWNPARHLGDLDEREIIRIGELFDVGPVTYPCYPQTTVEVVREPRAVASDSYDDIRPDIPFDDPSDPYNSVWRQIQLGDKYDDIRPDIPFDDPSDPYNSVWRQIQLACRPVSTERQNELRKKCRSLGFLRARTKAWLEIQKLRQRA